MNHLFIATIATVTAVIMHHLGLTEAISKVISKIACCVKCCTFWSCLMVLMVCGCNIFVAIFYAVVMAYLSLWTGPLLDRLNNLYVRLWQRKNVRVKKKPQR